MSKLLFYSSCLLVQLYVEMYMICCNFPPGIHVISFLLLLTAIRKVSAEEISLRCLLSYYYLPPSTTTQKEEAGGEGREGDEKM